LGLGIPVGKILIGIPIGKIPIRIWDKILIGIFPIGIPIGNFRKGVCTQNVSEKAKYY
jgi:hypothetical protein